MYRTWTRRRTTAALLLALLLPSCHGSNSNENRIKPITATLTIDPFPGSPDPAVYLLRDPKDPRFPDIESVQVRLHTTSPIAFDAFTLEFTYDHQLVQVGDVFNVNAALLGPCDAGGACDPLCDNNAARANQGLTLDADGKAHFFMGVAARTTCPTAITANVTTDTTLVTIGFIAATTIDAPGTRIELFTNPNASAHGDCEILQNVAEVLVGGQPIPCVDGNAVMTAAR
jgi:hypothetical protein